VNRPSALLSAIVTLATLTACATGPGPATITDTAARTPQLATLTGLINDAGLAETLRGPGPFTVFAPTDAAFAAVPAATLSALAKDKERLKTVLTYHVLPGKVMAADVKNGPTKTVQGGNVTLYRSGTFITIESAVVTTPDVATTNGVIHIIDTVLLPPAR
jgi:uncharacterized surface protein with fasciclin (FAS1) repeats